MSCRFSLAITSLILRSHGVRRGLRLVGYAVLRGRPLYLVVEPARLRHYRPDYGTSCRLIEYAVRRGYMYGISAWPHPPREVSAVKVIAELRGEVSEVLARLPGMLRECLAGGEECGLVVGSEILIAGLRFEGWWVLAVIGYMVDRLCGV